MLGAGLGIVLFLWVFRDVSPSAVLDRLVPLGLGGGLLALLPVLGASLLETAGWRDAFAVMGTRVGYWTLFRVRTATEAVSQTLPAGVVFSESLKIALLARDGLSTENATTGMLARKYLLMTSQVPYIAVAAVAGYAAIEALSRRVLGYGGLSWLLGLSGVVIGVAALGARLALSRGQLMDRLRALLQRIPSRRLRTALDSGAACFGATDRRLEHFFRVGVGDELRISALFFGGWLFESVETFLFLKLVGAPVDFSTAMAIEVVLSLLRMIVFVVPGGLGIQDAGYALFLNALRIPQATEIAAAFVVLKRSKELFYAAVGYGLLAVDLGQKRPVAASPALFAPNTGETWNPAEVRKGVGAST
jgi:uncharacterized membrane protein YbhN (UPF0104 family)